MLESRSTPWAEFALWLLWRNMFDRTDNRRGSGRRTQPMKMMVLPVETMSEKSPKDRNGLVKRGPGRSYLWFNLITPPTLGEWPRIGRDCGAEE